MTNIGLNVVEVDDRATPSIEGAPTSVAAFIIQAPRGVVDEVYRITNWSQFTQRFGEYVDGAYGAFAVRGFFDNGGTIAYVTRIVNVQGGPPTAAYIKSKDGPWDLGAGGKLILKSGPAEEHMVFLKEQSPAEVQGKDQPEFDLSEKNVIALRVNKEEAIEYTFSPTDFTNDTLEAATADEIAAVLNREFAGIRAWAEENVLKIRTDHEGVDALLAVSGEALEVLFGDEEGAGELVAYGGNIEALADAQPEEVAETMEHWLKGTGLLVKLDGKKIVVEHPQPGPDHVIEITGDPETLEEEIDFKGYPGQEGDKAIVAAPARKTLVQVDGNPALPICAGYRGQMHHGEWGNKISLKVTENKDVANTYDLTVRYGEETVETWEKLSWLPVTDGQVPKLVINDDLTGSEYIMVEGEDQLTADPAPMADFEYLEDGSDGAFANDAALGAGAGAALPLFDTYDVQLLCCPETADPGWVNAALSYCENEERRGDCMFVGHVPDELKKPDTVEKIKADYIEGESIPRSKYGALYFPWIRISHPATGQPLWIPPTGHVLGVYARTERERGIWKAPAGNAARVNGALNVSAHLTDIDHTALVKEAGVNAVRFIPGQGIVVDSSRTLSSDSRWQYVNVRLLFNFVKSSLKNSLRWVVQEPNDDTLWNKINYNSVTPFLMGLWRRGAFGPGPPEQVLAVKIDQENNPPENIQLGLLNIEVYFYPSRPAETIVIVVGQQQGGASASES